MDSQSKQKYFQTEEFKTLNEKWKKKLQKSGFRDVETDEEHLETWSNSLFSKRPEYDKSKEEYYRLAGQFLHSHVFQNKLERRIWEFHSDGVSIRDIVKAIKGRRGHVFVFRVIKSLATIMVHQCNNP